ncbi:MAG: DUF2163 domain-containing protein [Candidatus Korobacteraceae bacterium]
MSTTLINWLAANKNCMKADLFKITLPTGTVFYATEGQWDVTIPSGTSGWSGSTTTFKATTYGRWNRGTITSEASFSMQANTLELTCIPQPGTLYPGMTSTGILAAAANGLFDAASITVYTAYFAAGQYGTIPSGGIETKFQGTITKVNDLNRIKVVFECGDPMYLLGGEAGKIPKRLFQPSCPWSFCDSNCTLSASNYTVAFTAATGSTQYVLTPTSGFSQASGYFTQGVVTCTAGNNVGLSQTVKLHASGTLTLMNPWLLPVNAGDTFSVIAGCSKTMTACSGRVQANGTPVNNLINFGGTPFTPPSATSL